MLNVKKKKSDFIITTLKNVLVCTIAILSAAEVTTADITDGLVAYYPFTGDANDVSGNGNDGTVYGAVLTTDRYGNPNSAYWFGGQNDFIQIPCAPLNFGKSDITLSAWICANTLIPGGHGIVYKRDGALAHSAGYSLGINGDNQTALSTIGDGSGTKASIRSVSVVTDGQWHLITAVADRDGYGRLYIDGVPDGDPAPISHRSGSMDNGYDAMIGMTIASFGAPGYFMGEIDEVRIYNRALSEEEVRELAFGASKVDVDVRPGSCPNPLNVKDKGILSVAVLGSENLDVFNIDPASIRLEGVAPLRSSYEDVAAPVSNKADDCYCTTEGPDGFLDLVFKFDSREIVAALGGVYDGDEVILTLTGEALDGTHIEGTDCIVILAKGNK